MALPFLIYYLDAGFNYLQNIIHIRVDEQHHAQLLFVFGHFISRSYYAKKPSFAILFPIFKGCSFLYHKIVHNAFLLHLSLIALARTILI